MSKTCNRILIGGHVSVTSLCFLFPSLTEAVFHPRCTKVVLQSGAG